MRLVAQQPKTKLPTLLSVPDAARALGISRSLAYELAQRYEVSGGTEGLPVIRLGARLRVPDWALLELARTGRVVRLRDDLVTATATSGRANGAPAKGRADGSMGGRGRANAPTAPAEHGAAVPLQSAEGTERANGPPVVTLLPADAATLTGPTAAHANAKSSIATRSAAAKPALRRGPRADTRQPSLPLG
jgi:hypothetical protein